MLDQLESNSYYKLMHDNLFTSVKLCRGVVNANAKVLPLGAARHNDRGAPPKAFQLEEETKKKGRSSWQFKTSSAKRRRRKF